MGNIAAETITQGLNAAQAQAVVHDSGPLAVLAGPGTGKTRVIVHRIAHLLAERHALPESIVAVTFTVKAAQQMRERLAATLGDLGIDPELAVRVGVHTFHGLGLRLVRRFRDVLGLPAEVELTDRPQQLRLLRKLIIQNKLMPQAVAGGVPAAAADALKVFGYFYEQAMDPDAARAAAARWLSEAADGSRYEDRTAHEAALLKAERFAQTAELFGHYHQRCLDKGMLSFGDLVLQPVRLLRDSKRAVTLIRDEYRHLVVDEFQDVSPAQIELLRLIAPSAASSREASSSGRKCDLCVVGDDDQAIYGFRGADDRAFEKFALAWPDCTQIQLTENYRSAKPIVAAANSIIRRAQWRFAPDKIINAAGKHTASEPVTVVALADDKDNPEAVARTILIDRATRPGARFDDFAIIVRTNGDLDRVARRLQLEGIPVRMVRGLPWREEEGVQLVQAWAELLADGLRSYQATRLLREPPYNIELEVASRWQALYTAAVSRHEADSAQPHPGPFVPWLSAQLAREDHHAPAVRIAVERFIADAQRLTAMASEEPAAVVIFELVRQVEAAHAMLLPARDRKRRIECLLAMQRLASAKQSRLEAPGRIGEFLDYIADLEPADDGVEPEDQVDGDGQPERAVSPLNVVSVPLPEADAQAAAQASGPEASGQADAVTLLTAHTSKGLEFHSVIVPRANSQHGYPNSKGQSEVPALPPHLLVDPRGNPIDFPQRKKDEERRLFYVAATRAMQRLYIQTKHPATKSKSGSAHYPSELIESATVAPELLPLMQSGLDELKSRTSAASVIMSSDLWSQADTAAGGSLPASTDDLYRAASRSVRRRAASALDGLENESLASESPLGATDGTSAAARDALDSAEADQEPGLFNGAGIAAEAKSIEGATLAGRVAPLAQLGSLLAGFAFVRRNGHLPGFASLLDDRLKLELQRYEQRHRILAAGGKLNPTDDPLAMIFQPRQGPQVLSYSSLSSFEKCPRCHYIAQKYGIRVPQSEAQVLGIAAHDAMEMFYKQWSGTDASGAPAPGLEQLLELGRKAFFSRLREDQPADAGELMTLEAQLRTCFAQLHDPAAHVLELEMGIDMPLVVDGVLHRLTARIDRIDQMSTGQYRVIDYKTGQPSKRLLEPDPKKDLQFGIYALAIDYQYNGGQPCGGVAEYWVLSAGKKGVLELSSIDRGRFRDEITETVRSLMRGPYSRGKECWGVCQLISEGELPETEPTAAPEIPSDHEAGGESAPADTSRKRTRAKR